MRIWLLAEAANEPHGSLALSQMRQAYFHTGLKVLLAEIPDTLPVSTLKDPMAVGRWFRVVMTLSFKGLRQLFFFVSRAYFKELHGLFPLSCEKDAFAIYGPHWAIAAALVKVIHVQ